MAMVRRVAVPAKLLSSTIQFTRPLATSWCVRARVHVMAIVDCHSSRVFLHKRILVLCLS